MDTNNPEHPSTASPLPDSDEYQQVKAVVSQLNADQLKVFAERVAEKMEIAYDDAMHKISTAFPPLPPLHLSQDESMRRKEMADMIEIAMSTSPVGVTAKLSSAAKPLVGELVEQTSHVLRNYVDDLVKLKEPPFPMKNQATHDAVSGIIQEERNAAASMRVEVADSAIKDAGVTSWYARESSSTGRQHMIRLYADVTGSEGAKLMGQLEYAIPADSTATAMIQKATMLEGLKGSTAEVDLYKALVQEHPGLEKISVEMNPMDKKLATYDPEYTEFAKTMRELGMETRKSGSRLESSPTAPESTQQLSAEP